MTNDYLFIIGVGRSGTSLLQCMLNAHKDIAFLPETHFVRRYLHRNKSLRSIQSKLHNDLDLAKTGLNIEFLIKNASSVQNLYESILNTYGNQKQKRLVGDKDPKNIEYLKTISSHFPRSFVIHIYRDPRAVIASRKKAKWSSNRPLWKDLLAYKAQITYGRQFCNANIPQYLEIKYEELIQNPKNVISNLLHSLKLQYDPSIENYYQSSSEVISGEEVSWKKMCFEPLSTKGLLRWRDELTAHEINVIEYVLAKEMCEFGYSPITKEDKNSLSMWFYRLFIRLATSIYRLKFN